MTRVRAVGLAVAMLAALAAIAWISPDPNRVTDRGTYEASAAQVIVPDCSDLQCFRVLVPWVLGRLPGSSIVRWKAYAVAANAAAAAGVWLLCVTLGFGGRAAGLAAALSAFGFGSLYTLHDPFTADPLMFALGPFMTSELVAGRLGIAAVAGVVGVLAKEFAAAPLYAFALDQVAARQWTPALGAFAAGNAAFLTWALLTLTLMIGFGYSWGWNGVGSADLTGGAALALWAGRQSLRGIVFAMFNEFGALYVLAPVGVALAPRRVRRLLVASLPIAVVFAYVQQPDRGLWNFHYLVTPLAALVLERVQPALAWSVIGLFAVGNLRVGAQLPIATIAHAAIAASVILAAAGAATVLHASFGRANGGVTLGAAAR